MAKFFDILFLSLHIILATIVLILSIVSFTKINSISYKFIQGLGENWFRGPIIKITPRDVSCQMGEEVLFDDLWPGTIDGCDCSDITTGSFHDEPLVRELCSNSEQDRTHYCRNVVATNPIQYTTWGNKIFCGRRLNASYLDLHVAVNSNSCPIDTKSCGVIDTKDNVLCVQTSSSCPINKVIILNKGESSPSDFNYDAYPLADGKTLLTTNEDIDGEVIHEFKLSQKTPCLDTGFYNYAREPYKLLVDYDKTICPKLSSGKSEDDRVEYLDSISLIKFNEMNGIEKVQKTLPLYQSPPDSIMMNLYTREYYGLSINCRSEIVKIGLDKFNENLNLLDNSVDGAKVFTLIYMIMSIVAISIFIIGLIFILCTAIPTGLVVHTFTLIVYVTISLTILILSSLAAMKGNNLPKDYQILTINDCGDSVTDEIVTDFSEKFDTAFKINLASAFFSGLLTFYPGLFYITGMVNRHKSL